jgi:hypothetical protein
MSLTVETGAGIPTANAFITRASFIAWATDYYPAITVTNDATTDSAIMRASLWLSTFPEWDGEQTYGRGGQGLALPRTGMTDCNGDDVASNAIPVEAQNAVCYASLAEYVKPGVLTPTVTPGAQKKRVKADVVEVEYFDSSGDPTELMRPVLTSIRDLLKCMATFPDGVKVPWPMVL